MVIEYESNYLAHYGVKGQKWGQRRYQNYDGSLTAAGREHYGYGKKRSKYGEGNTYTDKQLIKSTAASVAGGFVAGGIGSSLARTAYARHVAKKQMANEGRSRDKRGTADAYKNNLAYNQELNRRTLQYLGGKKFDTAGDVAPAGASTLSSLAATNKYVTDAKDMIYAEAAQPSWVNPLAGSSVYDKMLDSVATQGRQLAGAAIVGGLIGAAANIGLDALTTYATKRILSSKAEKQAYQLEQMKNNKGDKGNKTKYGSVGAAATALMVAPTALGLLGMGGILAAGAHQGKQMSDRSTKNVMYDLERSGKLKGLTTDQIKEVEKEVKKSINLNLSSSPVYNTEMSAKTAGERIASKYKGNTKYGSSTKARNKASKN